MTNKFYRLLILPYIMISCNDDHKIITDNVPAEVKKIPAADPVRVCYMGVNKKDTVTLHIMTDSSGITGDLVYNHFEKDKNTGIIKGRMKGDTLIAEYTFMSEGVTSVREVAFLQKGKELVEGYGDQEEKNGKMIFKNKTTIDFDYKTTLAEVDCTGN